MIMTEDMDCDTSKYLRALVHGINQRIRFSQTLKRLSVQTLDVGALTEHCLHAPTNLGERLEYFNHDTLQGTISQMVLNVLDTDATAKFSMYSQHGSCALVSTAGYLTKFEHGSSIDQADFVIRVGAGPSEGFERHVGSRTDVRLIRYSAFDGTRGVPNLTNSELAVVMHDRIQSSTSVLSKSARRDLVASKSVPYINVHIWDVEKGASGISECILMTGKLRSGAHLSSGIWALLFLIQGLDFCNEIKLYGFLGSRFQEDPYHYWSMGLSGELTGTGDLYRSREGWGHPFAEEQRCLLNLSNSVADQVISYSL